MSGPSGRETISVVIPTKNAAHLLKDCLASIAWADDIVVVDMFSTDQTDAECAQYPQCRLVKRTDYIFGNVNHGFDLATGDWVMRLDTDEQITPELAAEIEQILRSPPADVTGFEFWERPIMLGRELRHGFGRQHFRKMMFRRGAARYPVQREHEDLETSGTWVRAKAGYLHYNYTSVGQYLEKMNYYTDRDLERTPRPTSKPKAVDAIKEPLRAFYLYYLKFQGFRDGWVGFVDGSMRAMYQLVTWAKARERWMKG